ncbi:MAG TPA: cupin domain-containing protein [Phytomonospora sp.]
MTTAVAATELFGPDGEIGRAWGTVPTVVRNGPLAALMPGADELLATPLLRPPFITVLDGGTPVPASRYCRTEHFASPGRAEQIVDPGALDAVLAAGAAVKFNRLELWSPVVAALASEIGAACGRKVKVWGFLSPHAQRLVPSHRDPAHVVAVQLDGRKGWILGGPCPEGAWSAMSAPVPGEETRVELEAGDILYLPYGYAHCAAAETSSSFHISFALEGTTAGELRHRIVKHVVDRLDGDDSTEVGEHNLAAIAAELSHVLGEAARSAAALPDRDGVERIHAGDTAEVIDRLLTPGAP